MDEAKIAVHEETLDPQDWDAMRSLGHRMIDEMMEYLEGIRDRPTWQSVPDSVKEHLSVPVPTEGQGPEQTYGDFLENVAPYPMGNISPRFWGWVMGTGTPMGVLAELLAATMNPNMGGGDHGAVYVEQQVIDWFKQIFSFPPDASGLLVSGGSMANLVGLAVARATKARFDIRKEGLQNGHAKMVLYASSETHSSVQKAVELMGLGSDALRKIPVSDAYEIDIAALEQAIAADKATGLHPFCIVGNAGTVNTGALDNLTTLADIAVREDMWFHVDGAFGSLAILTDTAPRLKGMDRADSLAFDLHKWLYMPFEAGCVLVRSEEAHRKSFSLTPNYLVHAERGVAAGSTWFSDYGVQLTRGFKALKVWMSIKEQGLDKYARLIQQNIDQASYLASLVEAEPQLELLAPVPLNIVNFRFVAPNRDDTALNTLNNEILLRLQEQGIAVPSSTTLRGKYAIRTAITNHRSRREDFDTLVRETLRLGREIVGK
jgi:aromatic-L-amino-acid/L-tryptophan decarboxylase